MRTASRRRARQAGPLRGSPDRLLASLLLGLCLYGGLAAAPQPAGAHALIAREDLPIPEWLFAWGASVVLIVSFVALTLAWRRPRLDRDGWRPVAAGISGAVVNRATAGLAGATGALLLGIVVWSGLFGTESPDRNFAVTFVFVTAWLGLVVASVLLGDVFRALNPWRAIARTFAAAFRGIAGQSPPALPYPERLGRWPAVAGIVAFAWFELVYGQSGFQAVGLTPESVALATLIYSAWTFLGMSLFGIDVWLDRGEAFSVYFGMFARLAPLEARDGRLGVRRPLAGATAWAAVRGSLAMVLVAIGVTAYDGAQEGALQGPIEDVFGWLTDTGLGPVASLRLTNSAFMALALGVVTGLYWGGVAGMHTVRGAPATRRLGTLFAHSFIPIALAYLAAHYFSLLVFQEQAQFTYLLSDPLGEDSNLFGTAGTGIDYGVLGAEAIWYVQVGCLVAGHVAALAIGHDRALTVFGDVRAAARSQYWMLALMVGFTSLGMFLLSQANA